ncbi:MAG: hypothetical protein ACYS8L_01775, partial [Planctomycetota bacterium]
MVLGLAAKDTLTAIELDAGETVRFRLLSGQVRELTLIETAAAVLQEWEAGKLYHFTARVAIDGHEMPMERYVGSQESFYEPYVVNGMRVWFDGVRDIF